MVTKKLLGYRPELSRFNSLTARRWYSFPRDLGSWLPDQGSHWFQVTEQLELLRPEQKALPPTFLWSCKETVADSIGKHSATERSLASSFFIYRVYINLELAWNLQGSFFYLLKRGGVHQHTSNLDSKKNLKKLSVVAHILNRSI